MRESWGGRAGRTTNSRIGWMLNDICGCNRKPGIRSLNYSVFELGKFSGVEKFGGVLMRCSQIRTHFGCGGAEIVEGPFRQTKPGHVKCLLFISLSMGRPDRRQDRRRYRVHKKFW